MNTFNIDKAAHDISAQSLASDTFNTRAAIQAQLTAWFGTSKGENYSRTQARLMDAVTHCISEAQWRLTNFSG